VEERFLTDASVDDVAATVRHRRSSDRRRPCLCIASFAIRAGCRPGNARTDRRRAAVEGGEGFAESVVARCAALVVCV
jgi:hypothetical protein